MVIWAPGSFKTKDYRGVRLKCYKATYSSSPSGVFFNVRSINKTSIIMHVWLILNFSSLLDLPRLQTQVVVVNPDFYISFRICLKTNPRQSLHSMKRKICTIFMQLTELKPLRLHYKRHISSCTLITLHVPLITIASTLWMTWQGYVVQFF